DRSPSVIYSLSLHDALPIYLMCLILTPIVYLWVRDIHLLLLGFAVYGFFIQGVFAWTPIWLPELFPTRMRATARSASRRRHPGRSEEHTSELQSLTNLVCRL